jgi:DNA-binding Lrp family transcriptional regulator
MNAKGNIRRGRESKTDIVELSVAETVSKNRIRSAKLSLVDKQILKKLLASQGDVSPRALEQELGIPRSTIQRRRRHLENTYLERSYSLNLNNLGFRRVDLLIYTDGRGIQGIAKELLKHDSVAYVGRNLSRQSSEGHTIDLRAEVVIKDNSELLGLLELVKAMRNVKHVIWSEVVEVVGQRRSTPISIIDKL